MTFAFKYVNTVKTYKYLGCLFDSSLPRNQYFDSCYRKACGRVRLLSKMRLYLTTEDAIKVYQAMILPRQIVGETNNFSDIEKTMKRDTCICVKKCLNKELCSNFDNYFDIIEHNKRTRQGGLRLPVIKLESTKYSFFFTGAKLFNSL